MSTELALPLPSFVLRELDNMDMDAEVVDTHSAKSDVLTPPSAGNAAPRNIFEYVEFSRARTAVFARHVLALQYNLPFAALGKEIFRGTVLHLSFRGGLLWNPLEKLTGERMKFRPLRTIPSDRFYLTGNQVTGYNSVNPRDEKFSLGGDLFYTARAAVSVPLGSIFGAAGGKQAAKAKRKNDADGATTPAATKLAARAWSLTKKSPVSVRANVFVSAGNVVPLYDGVRNSAGELMGTSRASAGAGLSVVFHGMRLYVDVAYPVLNTQKDKFTTLTYGVSGFYF